MERTERNTDKKQEWFERYHFASLEELEFKCYTLNSAVLANPTHTIISTHSHSHAHTRVPAWVGVSDPLGECHCTKRAHSPRYKKSPAGEWGTPGRSVRRMDAFNELAAQTKVAYHGNGSISCTWWKGSSKMFWARKPAGSQPVGMRPAGNERHLAAEKQRTVLGKKASLLSASQDETCWQWWYLQENYLDTFEQNGWLFKWKQHALQRNPSSYALFDLRNSISPLPSRRYTLVRARARSNCAETTLVHQ